MREFDMIFKGDAAFVCFVADIESNTPNGAFKRALRISDFYTKENGKWIQSGSDTQLHAESADEQYQSPRQLSDQMKKRLLEAREAVWRAYFSNDRAALEKLIPEDTVAINAGDNNWENRKAILRVRLSSQKPGKLVKLDSPRLRSSLWLYRVCLLDIFIRAGGWRTALAKHRPGYRGVCAAQRAMGESRMAHGQRKIIALSNTGTAGVPPAVCAKRSHDLSAPPGAGGRDAPRSQ